MESKFKGESFFLKGGEKAVILVHGFTSSTQEIEHLGLTLAQNGFTVYAPLLVGHNRNFAEFKKTKATDYYDSVVDVYNKLTDYKSIDIIGLSFGATLSLRLAINYPKIRKIVTLAPAIFYYDSAISLMPLLQIYPGKIMKKITKNSETGIFSRWDLFNPEALDRRIAYSWFAFPQLQSTRKFMQQVRAELQKIIQPMLIIHSHRDTTTKVEGARYLYDNIGSQDKQLFILEKSGHVITEDYEAKKVEQQIVNFLLKQ
jgi:carboxylesterase